MPEPQPVHNALERDLEAIEAFAAHPDQPLEPAARAARALYDDIVWRLARVELPEAARLRVYAIEARAAELVRDFARRGLPPRYFWADFAALAHELDAVTANAAEHRAETAYARRALGTLRRDVAAAALAPAARGPIHLALTALTEAVDAFEAGTLPAPALQARLEVANGLFAAAASAAGPDAAMPEPAAPAGPAPATGGPEGSQLARTEHRLRTAAVPPFVAIAAAELVLELRTLVEQRAAGTIDRGPFEASFTAGIAAVESCLAFARDARAERDIAARHIERLARRARAAELPAAWAGAVEDAIERLRALTDDLAAGRTTPYAFHQAFERQLEAAERLLTA